MFVGANACLLLLTCNGIRALCKRHLEFCSFKNKRPGFFSWKIKAATTERLSIYAATSTCNCKRTSLISRHFMHNYTVYAAAKLVAIFCLLPSSFFFFFFFNVRNHWVHSGWTVESFEQFKLVTVWHFRSCLGLGELCIQLIRPCSNVARDADVVFVVDRFHIALFSALEETYCALVACDSKWVTRFL